MYIWWLDESMKQNKQINRLKGDPVRGDWNGTQYPGRTTCKLAPQLHMDYM